MCYITPTPEDSVTQIMASHSAGHYFAMIRKQPSTVQLHAKRLYSWSKFHRESVLNDIETGKKRKKKRNRYAVDMSKLVQPQAGKNEKLLNPLTGDLIFGLMPELTFNQITFPPGEVYLLNGEHRRDENGYGARHVWGKHGAELPPMGYKSQDDVRRYVADILQPNASIFPPSEDDGNNKVLIVQLIGPHKRSNMAVIGYKGRLDLGGGYYHIVTAYPKKVEGRQIGALLG